MAYFVSMVLVSASLACLVTLIAWGFARTLPR